jgi:hypothetical protein
MLKAVIDKLEDAAEAVRGEYKQGDGGKFYLDVTGFEEGTGHPAVGELVRAKKREADEATAQKATAAKFKIELDEAKEALHKRLQGKVDKSDLEALDKSYLQKLADADAAGKQREGSLSASLREVLVDREARAIATGIALDTNAADLLAESVQRRLTVEITTEGKAVTRVLGLDGKPSAASLEDLKKEIVATPKYHALLSGSKASGSGATPGGSGSGAPSGSKNKNTATMSPSELVAHIDAKHAVG